MSLGMRIRESRTLARLSQSQLGEMVGKDSNAISRWERDLIYPKAETILTIAQALNVSVAYLLGETDEPSREVLLGAMAEETDTEKDSQQDDEVIKSIASNPRIYAAAKLLTELNDDQLGKAFEYLRDQKLLKELLVYQSTHAG